ncbi:bifunctional 6-phosphofructo-2-kinase/fructose-2,6-bisphosphate 2-phosphatase [Stemphylium lycopersici]|uniref:Bifunctional 6-phosphofructo-2-kinase/fructose-2,6-bisphosphate 2-phosphatase n=1 Tax=Stemphylium lycopersici TaxID=183478 RepID=A0A364N078_STELY|nr:6-phosphofructo-2-kinase 1 [Stemphylium lycopersici]RAR04249.1 bifunctional 6-phosphofructo-2-kinase/fructose-2,6-bisphosphate 2-phosphatase [Stemphylium lycopersici]RAR08490.1 bifunctional 6-phosphofructo-2-kinase/fructose-2,6-bisphosphate 2-phosphatase [Stemphylium lycopersici]
MAAVPTPMVTELVHHKHSHSRRRSSASSPNSTPPNRRFSTHSTYARSVMSKLTLPLDNAQQPNTSTDNDLTPRPVSAEPKFPAVAPAKNVQALKERALHNGELKGVPNPVQQQHQNGQVPGNHGVGTALSDTPLPSVPGSPREYGEAPPQNTSYFADRNSTLTRNSSAAGTPRLRPTTLDIPGLTKSKVSPDGKIAQRDVGSKLVIVMVGLPARGKSYITKKMARYLNWLQHDTKIFNVGEKRRVAASHSGFRLSQANLERVSSSVKQAIEEHQDTLPQIAAKILINGDPAHDGSIDPQNLPDPRRGSTAIAEDDDDSAALPPPRVEVTSPGPKVPTPNNEQDDAENESMDQSADFFDPQNQRAAALREQCAMETLDDLLDYILKGSGSVGIFDATNSTLARRQQIMEKIRQRAGPELNVLFVESVCRDQDLLESNMRLKLSGPDYADKDPVAALADFKKRVAIYEKNYVPIGDYEEDHNMPYVQMVDVGRKMISHQIKGFLAGQAVYYLLNFNLAPRMIWITRHGESTDNVAGKIGGDSDLSPDGQKYAKAMTRFITAQRKEWAIRQADKRANTHFPPVAGDHTPPNPYYSHELETHNFCVWTSMLKRGIQTGQYFCDEDFEVKQMRMLDELNAGLMEGLTYEEIRTKYADEYLRRRRDKLAYRYPGPGGEGYLDVINRIRPVIVELERMTDHCLLITHRSVARVLLAYFQGLKREDVADLDCPLGMLYQLEPKPYGVEFKAWRYNHETDDFDHLPDYKLRRGPIMANN